ncbi:MAG: type II secretion system protein [Planctomycetes bacterium]|nr:type II secretion system protein [Planctomycetota bacterium]
MRHLTLVELLVVGSILVILMALLVPVLRKSLVQARLAECASQLKQMYMATIFYCEDHNMDYPAGTGTFGWKCPRYYSGGSQTGPGWYYYAGPGLLWNRGYLDDKEVLIDPGWMNDSDSTCVSYMGKNNWTYFLPADPEKRHAKNWSTGTYVYLANTWTPGKPVRRMGMPMHPEITAVSMCRQAGFTSFGTGCHDKEWMNCLYEDGHLRLFGGIAKHLAENYTTHPAWCSDAGNDWFYITYSSQWWLWTAVEDKD